MPDTMTQTYTPDNQYERQATQYRSQVGDNPEAVRQAAAKEMVGSNQELQGAIQQQGSAVDAMGQLAAYDQELAGKFQQTAQQKTQQVKDVNAFTTGLGTGQTGTFTVDQINQMLSTPENAILSPFTQSGMVQGTQDVAQNRYDLAAQTRGSLERAIGTEAQAIANIAQTQMERERLEKERARAEARQRYEDERQYAMLMGGTVLNPDTGKEERYETPQEKQARENKEKGITIDLSQVSGNGYVTLPEEQKNLIRENALNTLGSMGQGIAEALKNGTTSIDQILRSNPNLNPAQKLAIAELSSTYWGGFRENDDQLRAMGYNPEDLRQRGLIAGQSGDVDYLSQAFAMPGAAEIIGTQKNQAAQKAIARAIVESGGVENYLGKKKSVAGLSQGEQKMAVLLDELIKANTNPLTGTMRLGLNPVPKLIRSFLPSGIVNKEDYESIAEKNKQIQAALELIEAEAMEGQGTISQGERQILAQAASSLGLDERGRTKISDTSYENELKRMYESITGRKYGEQNQTQQPQQTSGGYVIEEVQ